MKRVLIVAGLIGLALLAGCWSKANSGPNGPGWSGFDPEQGKFSVAMPGTPKEKSLEGGSPGKSWTSSADGLTYTVGYAELALPEGTAETDKVEEIMDDELDHMLRTQVGTLAGPPKKPLMVGGVPGQEVDIDVDGKTVRRIRMCVVGNRLYSVEVSGPKEKVASSEVEAFLDSFKATK